MVSKILKSQLYKVVHDVDGDGVLFSAPPMEGGGVTPCSGAMLL